MLGGYRDDFNLMIIGRGIYGVGCESMYVGQTTIISAWFINYELPIAIAMITCVPLCGSFLGGALVPTIYEKNWSFGEAFRVGWLMTIIGFLLILILTFIDYKTEKHDKKLLEKFIEEKKQARIKAGIFKKEKGVLKAYKAGADIE